MSNYWKTSCQIRFLEISKSNAVLFQMWAKLLQIILKEFIFSSVVDPHFASLHKNANHPLQAFYQEIA